jgi:hypothetical protein
MLRSPTPATAKVAVAGDPGSAQHDSTESVLRYAQDHTHEGLIMRDRFGALTENYPTSALGRDVGHRRTQQIGSDCSLFGN